MPRGRPRKTADDVLGKSAELLGWALGGLEREISQTRDRLASLTAQASRLRDRLGVAGSGSADAASSDQTGAVEGGRSRRRRKMSAEARRRISETMKKKWAERRKGTT
jgi:hypothetical protein